MTTPCPKCRGIHTLISPKFCPECWEQLLELQQSQGQATPAVERCVVTPEQFRVASHRLQKQAALSTADYDSLIPPATDAEIKHAAQFSPGSVTPAAEVKHATRELEHWRCEARNWRDVAEKLQAEVDRLHQLFGPRFHLDSACGSCDGPLDVERDAICCRCTDGRDAAIDRLTSERESYLAERQQIRELLPASLEEFGPTLLEAVERVVRERDEARVEIDKLLRSGCGFFDNEAAEKARADKCQR